jgi:pachytene checkpoint protein 2
VQTIPEFAARGPAIVLLDEVETLAGDRQRMSLETNPIDATAPQTPRSLASTFCAASTRNTLLIATTNFPKAVDRALLSRADWIEDVALPNAEARQEIIADAMFQLASAGRKWPNSSPKWPPTCGRRTAWTAGGCARHHFGPCLDHRDRQGPQ